ncbi:MAG TPA: TonB-dependent receptor [Burkholderiaceae bacterium]|nr:TonB-dependent receptor [Burkholderiaceae bacterium]
MNHRFRMTAAGALVAAGTVGAQTLTDVRVEERRIPSPALTAPSIEAAATAVEQIPGGASVVDLRARQDRKLTNLTDALGETAGVFVQPRFGQDESRLSIRGSGLQRTFHLRGIKLLQDGVPLNQADGGADFQATDPLMSRYAIVERGANALRYGATTLGGAIDFVSPTGYDLVHASGRPGVHGRVEVGSFGFRRLQAMSGGVGGHSDYALGITHYREDGFREHSETAATRLSGNFGWRPSERFESRWYFAVSDSDSQLPGNLGKAELREDPREANRNNLTLDQRRDLRLYRLANKTAWQWDDSQLELGGFVMHRDLLHPIFQLLDVSGNDAGFFVRYRRDGSLFGLPQRWTLGFEPQASRQTDRRYVNLGGTRGQPTAHSRQTATNLDLYAESQTDLNDRLTLVAGAQATRAERRYEDRMRAGGVDRSFDTSYSRVSPKLGFLYRPWESTTIFGNVSGAFEPPSFGELAGGPGITQVDAQRARSVELGARGRGAYGSWEAVAYRAELRGELLGLNDALGQPLGTVNADRTVHQGLEVAARLRPARWAELSAAWLLQDFAFDGDPVYGDNRLPGLPRQFLRATLDFHGGGGLTFGPSVEWSPQRYPVDMANTLFADSYAIWGFRISGPLGASASWWIEGRNLSDKRYAASTGVVADAGGRDAAQFLPGNGRSVYAGLQIQY